MQCAQFGANYRVFLSIHLLFFLVFCLAFIFSDAVTCINPPNAVRETEALTYGCELDYYGLRDVDDAKRPTLTFDGAADDQVSTQHQRVKESGIAHHRKIV